MPTGWRSSPMEMASTKNMLIAAIFALCCLAVNIVSPLECYACDSAEDAECATRPGQQISVEECASPDDMCVTVIVAGSTRRGCLTRLYPNKFCNQPCDQCATSLCNRHVFPATRLRCYQCAGADCIDVGGKEAALLLPCPVYHETDRCYMNVIGLSNVQRGCEHTNLPAGCPNVCLKCNFDGCNRDVGVTSHSCLECKHTALAPHPACLRAQRAPTAAAGCVAPAEGRCANKVMFGHAAKCYTYRNEQTDVVERGCATTMPFYPSGSVAQCYGEDCNAECLPIKCNVCNATRSDAGFNCRHGRNLRPQQCAADDSVACFSCESGQQLRRGCGPFEPHPDEVCHECRDGDGCNRASVRSCFHCSSLEQAACADQLDGASAAEIARRNCSRADELCVSTLVAGPGPAVAPVLVHTVRGCASHVPECTGHDALCVRCNGSLCNTAPLASWYHPALRP